MFCLYINFSVIYYLSYPVVNAFINTMSFYLNKKWLNLIIPVFSIRKTSYNEIITNKKQKKSQTVSLIAHTWVLYSLSWLTGLFKSNSMHLWPSITWVFSATESPFSFKILNSHTTMHGEALRGRLYLFIGTKANFSFFQAHFELSFWC